MNKSMATTTRLPNGQFAPGHPGGPGRPRRAIEADYLTALADACSLDTWREICNAAVERAREGDQKAIEWLARYLLGSNPAGLLDLAAAEVAGLAGEVAVRNRAREKRHQHEQAEFYGMLGPAEE